MKDKKGALLVRRLMMMHREFEKASDYGTLTQGEFLVLRRISLERSEENMIRLFKAVKISDGLKMPPPAVSRVLNSLENKGLIERQINVENRRSVVIHLTQKGLEVLNIARQKVQSFGDGLIEKLGEKDSDLLLQLLEKVENYCKEFK